MIHKTLIVLAHGVVGWALCAATVAIGMAITTQSTALVAHAILAPVYFAFVTWRFHTRYGHTSPLTTAIIFTALVIALDFFVVALLILKSTEMFASLLGTWIPFALIFLSTWLVGTLTTTHLGAGRGVEPRM